MMNLEDLSYDFQNLANVTDRLANEHNRLADAVDAAQERLEEAVNRLDVPTIAADLEYGADEIERLELQLAEAKLQLAEAKYGLEQVERDIALAWKDGLEEAPKDPSTGRANKDHTEAVLEAYLYRHEEVEAARDEVRDREHNVTVLRAELEGTRARMSAVRHRARLTASVLVFMSEPARSLGRMQTALANDGRAEWKEEV